MLHESLAELIEESVRFKIKSEKGLRETGTLLRTGSMRAILSADWASSVPGRALVEGDLLAVGFGLASYFRRGQVLPGGPSALLSDAGRTSARRPDLLAGVLCGRFASEATVGGTDEAAVRLHGARVTGAASVTGTLARAAWQKRRHDAGGTPGGVEGSLAECDGLARTTDEGRVVETGGHSEVRPLRLEVNRP